MFYFSGRIREYIPLNFNLSKRKNNRVIERIINVSNNCELNVIGYDYPKYFESAHLCKYRLNSRISENNIFFSSLEFHKICDVGNLNDIQSISNYLCSFLESFACKKQAEIFHVTAFGKSCFNFQKDVAKFLFETIYRNYIPNKNTLLSTLYNELKYAFNYEFLRFDIPLSLNHWTCKLEKWIKKLN